MEKYFCCTTCPLECKLTVTVDERDNSFIAVAGNRCPRGEIFARQELVLPLRVLTTTVRLEGGRGLVLLPVRSDRAFALARHRQAVRELRALRCRAGRAVHKGIAPIPGHIYQGRHLHRVPSLGGQCG